ncbi:MAG: alpha-L-rhamnosidase [Thermoprotei archaeon]|nr:MAG: alpha-L-rhamnosidase [Thermoprotei archaeon]
MEWKAKWIWEKNTVAPRNYYLCFRKTFNLPKNAKQAFLHITADSRYVLYVNGIKIGQGPARSWPFKQAYDTYDVKHLLKRDKNVIAVLVQHYGISTFQYIEGRGGLLCQLEIEMEDSEKFRIASDSTWLTHPHPGYSRRTPRISCQQAWSEVYDARRFDEKWVEPEFDDSGWEHAIELGPVGTEPWKTLVPRGIKFLTEEPAYPVAVLRVRAVKPLSIFQTFDLRPNLLPGKVDANPGSFIALVATCIKAPKACKVKLKHAYRSKWFSVQGPMRVNGKDITEREGEWWIAELKEGENLFIMDVSGNYHEWFVHLIIDSPVPLEFCTPWIEGDYHWVTIGPFHTRDHEAFTRAWNATKISDLEILSDYMKPVLPKHEAEVDVYSITTTQRELKEDKPEVKNIQSLYTPTPDYAVIYPQPGVDVEVLIDFGRELVGFIEFEIDAPEGTVFDWNFFEAIVDGKIQFTDGLNNTLRYVAREGHQKYRSIIGRGFRYALLTLRNFNRPVRIYRVCCLVSTYPVTYRGEFKCSDQLLNEIWDMCRYSTRLCMLDTFIDCPAYEQTFWVGDARVQMLSNYYAFGELDMPRRCLFLVADSLRRSPLPESQVPSGWQNILATWSLLWVIACYEYFIHSGDIRFLEEIYPYLKKTCDNFLKHLNEKNLLVIEAWNMLDWAPMDIHKRGVITHLNAWLVYALKRTADIAKVLGKGKDRRMYLEKAETIKEAINRYLWSEERKAYVDSMYEDGRLSNVISQQTNVVVYLCGCATSARKRIIRKYLSKPPEGFVTYGSPFAASFGLEALAKAGLFQTMLNTIKHLWGMMIKYSATTCWETFPKETLKRPVRTRITRSWCHAWGAGPVYVLSRYILGIRPLEPGFKKVLIEPHYCDLKWAEGRIPTPFGKIEVCWDRSSSFYFRASVPEEVEAVARLHLPSKEFKVIGDIIKQKRYTRKRVLEVTFRGTLQVFE